MTTRLFINEKQQRQLAELLETCPSMTRQRDRDSIIGQLAPEIRRQIRPEGKPANVVMEMVAACAHYTDGVENLVRAVAAFEGDSSVPMAGVWENLPAALGFFDGDIHETISKVLIHLTEGYIDRDAMASVFREAVPEQLRAEYGWPNPDRMCRWWMLREAAKLDQRRMVSDFFRLLLACIPEQPRRLFGILKGKSFDASRRHVEALLTLWASQGTGERVSSFKRAKKETPPSNVNASDRPHLIVQLAPNLAPVHENAYRVSFHLHSEKSDGRPLADPEKELEDLSSEDIEFELDEFLRRLDDDSLPRAVEVMVPGDYLTTVKPPPHLWRLKAGRRKGRESLLGEKYAVYLRLNRHERLDEEGAALEETPADQRRSWKAKWRDFTDSKSPEECIEWECDSTACGWASLRPKLCHSKGRPCLILAFEPEIPPDDAWLNDVLLESGVPVALWGDAGEADIRPLLKPLIDGGSLRGLPAHLWEQRESSNETELPYRLTLLWDNPDRDIHGRRSAPETPTYFDDSAI